MILALLLLAYPPICDASLDAHLYHASRLELLAPCVAAVGVLTHRRVEPDGDYHVLLRLDPEYADLLGAGNFRNLRGYLLIEVVCAGRVTQRDAIAACAGFRNTIAVPVAGTRVRVVGRHVHDRAHDWNELHPVSSIQRSPSTPN